MKKKISNTVLTTNSISFDMVSGFLTNDNKYKAVVDNHLFAYEVVFCEICLEAIDELGAFAVAEAII